MNNLNPSEISDTEHLEINFKELLNAILRQRLYFLGITSLSFFVGILYAINLKPTWEGHFQIVIKNENNNMNKGSAFSQFSSILNINQNVQSDLLTELKILESPLIIKPIFDFVKSKKSKLGIDVTKWNFYSWKKKSLNINLARGTSVLTITYKDGDKSLIVPVLNKLSNTYQNYSGLKRKKGILQTLDFLNQQVKITQIQSEKSLAQLQNFSFENGLGNFDGLPMPNNKGNKISMSGIKLGDIESRQLLEKLSGQNLKNTNLESRYTIQYEKLEELNSEYIEKSAILKPNSKHLLRLKEKINVLKSSLTRAPKILIEYRKLNYQASRDENLLDYLQNALTSVQLENSKQTNPWSLISEPTLIDEPISISKKRFIAYFLLGSIAFASFASIVIDQLSGRLNNVEKLKELIKYPLLKTLSFSSSNWHSSIDLISDILKENGDGLIGIIPVGDSFKESQIRLMSDSFVKALGESNVVFSNDLIETSKCSNQLLIFAPGSCTNYQLNQILEDLKIQKAPVAGWILIDS